MKTRIKGIVIFVLIHLFIITGFIIYWAYKLYPSEAGFSNSRAHDLKQIYEKIELYKDEMGKYPESLDSLLHYDKEKHQLLFRSEPIDIYIKREDIDINERIRYQLKDKVPVLTDLGGDGKEGGLKFDIDVTYPQKYQKPFPFRDFVKTDKFIKSVLYGLLFAFAMSICLYGIMKKRFSDGTVSLKALATIIFISIVFLLFELTLANFIMFGHLYPHH